MNGIHDMGGMHGFGPVVREENEPVFHEPWEGRAYGAFSRLGAKLPPPYPGVGRTYIESIPPARYLQMSYYERFLESAVQRAISGGLIAPEEFEARLEHYRENPSASPPRREDPAEVDAFRRRLSTQLRPAAEGRPPRFKEGDPVRAINVNRAGHNRLPRYIRGKRGTIERVNGLHPIEDEMGFSEDPMPQAVYTVGFDGVEVWGSECEPNLRVYLELWEGYLTPVSSGT